MQHSPAHLSRSCISCCACIYHYYHLYISHVISNHIASWCSEHIKMLIYISHCTIVIDWCFTNVTNRNHVIMVITGVLTHGTQCHCHQRVNRAIQSTKGLKQAPIHLAILGKRTWFDLNQVGYEYGARVYLMIISMASITIINVPQGSTPSGLFW